MFLFLLAVFRPFTLQLSSAALFIQIVSSVDQNTKNAFLSLRNNDIHGLRSHGIFFLFFK